ncbi:MAG: hypothetical protein HUU60_00320 [Armatimonadetes bacterium]|nr:hypothetical protein [Armatimonadota bacterium]
MRFFLSLIAIVAILAVTGCTTDGGGRAPTGSTWTIMVFLNAANDLDEFSDLNVNQMERAAINDEVKMVVQWKRASRFVKPGTWTGTRRYLVKHDQTDAIGSQLLQDMGQGVDMGNADVLKEFVLWAKTNFPADRYMLVVWNHGSGWRSHRPAPLGRGVSFDDELGTSINTWELPGALADTKPLDILAFDASLMQMLEVAYECKDVAQLIVGSEESPPAAGYPYDLFMRPLAQNPAMSTIEFAETIVNKTIQHYGQNSNITHSVLDASKLQSVADALDQLASLLIAKRPQYQSELALARQQGQSYSSYTEYKDLRHVTDLVRQRTGDAQIGVAVGMLHQRIDAAVLAEVHGNNGVQNSHGVSIYFPSAGEFLRRYKNLALARATLWDEWLEIAP